MWSINGRLDGVRYMVWGDSTSVTVPEWLWAALRSAVVGTSGVLEMIPNGPSIRINDDPATMLPADVVRVLESMTSIEDVHGELPSRDVQVVFDDTRHIY